MVYHIIAGLCALLLSMLGGYTLLPVLKKLRVGQTINELGPQNHMAKQGALTMGGVSFLAAGLLCSLAFGFRYKNDHGQLLLYCVLCTLSFGLVGFVDDYLKVVRHRSEGLTVKQKLLPQIVLAIVFAVIAYASDSIGSGIMLPFTSKRLELGVFYIPVAAFVIVAVDNSANILDGLDGLLSSNSSIAFAALSAYATYTGIVTQNGSLMNTGVFCLCMCAAVFGFLRYNTHPAKMFMGDVGSLGIGGALAAVSIVSGSMLMLPFMLVTMMISSLSDFAQVIYMRRHHGRKLMRMSPLHHHLELGGMPETHVVSLYSTITLIGCAAAFILFI